MYKFNQFKLNKSNRKQYDLAAVAFIIFVSSLWYYPALNLQFVSDDYDVLDLIIGKNINQSGFFRLIGNLTLSADYFLFGLKPFYFHLGNLICHTLNSVLAYFLTFFFIDKESENFRNKIFISLFSAIFFSINPLASETIIWVTCRGVLLATTFSLVSLYYFFIYNREEKKIYLAYSAIAFFIAMLCYETAIAVPIIIALLTIIKPNKNYTALVPFIISLALYFSARYFFDDFKNVETYYRLDNFLNLNLFRLLSRTVTPPQTNTGIYLLIFGCVSLLLIISIIKAGKPKGIFIAKMVLLIIISVLPCITVGIDTHDFEGGRFIYSATIFSSILMAYVCIELIKNKNLMALCLGLVLLYYTIFSIAVMTNWQKASNSVQSILNYNYPINDTYIFQNIPDNYNGAYIFRNGLEKALKLYNRIPASSKAQIQEGVLNPSKPAGDFVIINFAINKKTSTQ